MKEAYTIKQAPRDTTFPTFVLDDLVTKADLKASNDILIKKVRETVIAAIVSALLMPLIFKLIGII